MLQCECADHGCPSCGGACDNGSTETLYRVDMQDTTGTQFCIDCAQDAFGAGVFTDQPQEEDCCVTYER